MKTVRWILYNPRHLNMICECFLCFYTSIIFTGIVSRTERLGVQQLAKQARQWSANVTFNFLYALLSRVKELLEASPDLTYYVFEFDPSKKCITFQTSPSSDKFSFLPNWFLANFDKSELISGNPKGVFL